jgi:signal transduction histidine kinase
MHAMSKLERLPLLLRVLLVLASAAVIFAADYATGWDITLRGLYVVPVALAAWSIGRWAGVLMSVIGLAVNLYLDALVPHTSFRVWIISDTGVRLFIYLAATFLIRELHDAYRAAQRATEARQHVLGIVAHDLRNPLATILLAAPIVRSTAPSTAHVVASIERAAHRMNRLIADLLDVTRIEAGALSVELARAEPAPIMRDAVEAQRTLAASKGVELRLDVPNELPEIWCDHDRLVQVFENLISNALKFTERDGRVTVSARYVVGEVEFSVSDSGVGIDEKDLPLVFDRFWQAEKTKRDGAGLGLSIVKGVVEAHHGHIRVESVLHRGTTFVFTIPTRAPTTQTALSVGPIVPDLHNEQDKPA